VGGVVGCAIVTPLSVMVPALWLVGAVILVVGFAEGAMQAPSLPLLAEVTEGAHAEDAGQFGAVYAIFDTSFALGGLIGPVAGGALVEVIDLKLVLMLYSAALLAYVPVLWWRLRRVRPRPGASATAVARS
jgi:MFS family permease